MAAGHDQKPHAVLHGGAQGLLPGCVHQLPKLGRTEIEDRPRAVDRNVIVVTRAGTRRLKARATVSSPTPGAP
ncbi:hypothetical protein [Reyranella sp.]|uniref:hypothetical protein n=1 Tax=Reyranella sp. TaxID=1929291 RepID=UPI0037845417